MRLDATDQIFEQAVDIVAIIFSSNRDAKRFGDKVDADFKTGDSYLHTVLSWICTTELDLIHDFGALFEDLLINRPYVIHESGGSVVH